MDVFAFREELISERECFTIIRAATAPLSQETMQCG